MIDLLSHCLCTITSIRKVPGESGVTAQSDLHLSSFFWASQKHMCFGEIRERNKVIEEGGLMLGYVVLVQDFVVHYHTIPKPQLHFSPSRAHYYRTIAGRCWKTSRSPPHHTLAQVNGAVNVEVDHAPSQQEHLAPRLWNMWKRCWNDGVPESNHSKNAAPWRYLVLIISS